MTPPHRIRLRGFWEVTPLPDGRARHRRAFGRPRTLDPGERAWLVCDAVPGSTVVSVNGDAIGTGDGGAFAADVTDRLNPRNDVVFATPAGAELGEVALEIRAAVE
ncbi:MAG: hypothetical protein ACRC7O_18830 [Fimbriiglobus sp.]